MNFQEFGQKKASGFFPTGTLPIWEEDGFKMPQGNSILRMLGIRYGYYTEDGMQAHAIDSILDYCEGMVNVGRPYIAPALNGKPISEDCDSWIADFWKPQVQIIGNRLAGHGKKFIAGTDRPTIADFKAFTFYSTSFSDLNPGCAVPESA